MNLINDTGRALEILESQPNPAPVLGRLYSDWCDGDMDVWRHKSASLLNEVDPIVRTLSKEFGFRFSRNTLADFLEPAALFKMAFCSEDEIPDLYASKDMERLRARFSILPRIRDARDAEQVLSDAERFLHPLNYIAMASQYWLRSDQCALPDDEMDLNQALAAY
ncbi:hypothetical protein ABIC83_002964 [Roseateles asaccharophilus]|uniref:hypothetical protein n=1 Tax=Roseateles asaccharophilus TaxID=582607 RepID=UPI003835A5B7